MKYRPGCGTQQEHEVAARTEALLLPDGPQPGNCRCRCLDDSRRRLAWRRVVRHDHFEIRVVLPGHRCERPRQQFGRLNVGMPIVTSGFKWQLPGPASAGSVTPRGRSRRRQAEATRMIPSAMARKTNVARTPVGTGISTRHASAVAAPASNGSSRSRVYHSAQLADQQAPVHQSDHDQQVHDVKDHPRSGRADRPEWIVIT